MIDDYIAATDFDQARGFGRPCPNDKDERLHNGNVCALSQGLGG